MANLIIGVDGGQTSTKCVLMDEHMTPLGYGTGSELRHLVAAGGKERHINALRECISQAFAQAGLSVQPIAAIGLGFTGISGEDTPLARMARDLIPSVIQANMVAVESDAYTALLGAHGNAAGVIAIAGTGSNVMGINAKGQVKRAGGWGWLLGDEGSAMRIGREGVSAALLAWDKTGEPTAMLAAFQQEFGFEDMHHVKPIIYAADFGPKNFGALAVIVSRCAQAGDAIARRVIEQNGAGLARQAEAVLRQLDPAQRLPISLIGGAFEHVFGLRQSFEGALTDLGANYAIVTPQMPPMFGAAIMAMNKLRAAAA